MYISHFIEKICEMACLYLLHWFTKLFYIKYKNQYQKSKWTIEYRIFIAFIWSRSDLWKCYNDNVFTKKQIFATYIGMSRFPQPYVYQPSVPTNRKTAIYGYYLKKNLRMKDNTMNIISYLKLPECIEIHWRLCKNCLRLKIRLGLNDFL